MVKSDHSETEEDMDKLHLSSDNSFDIAQSKKRPRVADDEDEADLPAAKCPVNEQSRISKSTNSETVCNKIDERLSQDTSMSELETELEEKCNKKVEQENGNKSPLDEESVLNSSFEETNAENNMDNKLIQESEINTNVTVTSEKTNTKKKDNMIIKEDVETMIKDEKDEKEDSEEERKNDSEKKRTKKQHTTKKHNVDIEVVDGLELLVECASDNDESSSESKDEENVKPRPKTIIVKAEPNESELECSSDGEKSDSSQIVVDKKIKSKKGGAKKKNSRTSFSKLKASDSENSQNSNLDEDYSPRTKKKMKKSSVTTKKLANKQSLNESKRGRGRGVKKISHKKNDECTSDEDDDVIAAKREDKTMKSENGTKEELSEKEATSKDESESDSNSEKEEKVKSRKNQRGDSKSNKRIELLRKYLKVAGIRVKCYKTLFADCKSNSKKIKRLLELFEQNGITGRPTLEKCKQARKINEEKIEVSELDMSNIISEGRVTRARRNKENVNKGILPETPSRHREARSTFRRIQTVVDSDSD